MPPVSLRPSTADDLTFVYDLLELTIRRHLENSGQVWPEVRVRRRLAQHVPAGDFEIIVLDAQRIGALMAQDRPQELWLDTLCLLPPWQGQGLGSSLVERVAAQARSRQVPVRLHVFRANPARGFWARQGFTVVGEDAHALHMERAP